VTSCIILSAVMGCMYFILLGKGNLAALQEYFVHFRNLPHDLPVLAVNIALYAGFAFFWFRYIKCNYAFASAARLYSAAALSRIQDGVLTSREAILVYNGIRDFLSADFSGALSAFEKTAEICETPENRGFCYAWAAECYLAIEKPEDAARAYEQAARSLPKDSLIQSKLAYCYYLAGQLSKAEYRFNNALETKDDAFAHCMLGNIYAVKDELDKAAEQYEIAYSQQKDEYIEQKLALAYLAKGEYEKSTRFYNTLEKNEKSESFEKFKKMYLALIKHSEYSCSG